VYVTESDKVRVFLVTLAILVPRFEKLLLLMNSFLFFLFYDIAVTNKVELSFMRTVFYMNSGNACYHSVLNLLSSHLQSKDIQIKIYKTIIVPVVLYGCEKLVSDIRVGT
jgi:hypothetical protein